MGHGYFRQYTASVASAATAALFDLGRAWGSTYLLVPSMTSNSQIHIQASPDNTTFRRVTHPSINSSTVAVNDFTIPSSVTNRCVPIPPGFQYIKVELTATADSGQAFTVICSDE